jgi:hypothetical protein
MRTLDLVLFWFRSSMHGKYYVAATDEHSDLEVFQDFLAAAMPSVSCAELTAYLNMLSGNYSASKVWGKIERAGLTEVHNLVTAILAERNLSMLLLESGEKCWCFGQAEQGDIIYLVSGVELALIMRPSGSHSQLIASTYMCDATMVWKWSWKTRFQELQKRAYDASCKDTRSSKMAPMDSLDYNNKLENLLSGIRIR